MEKLEGVNIILAAIGSPGASALDTNGTSEVAEAETYLDRSTKLIQARSGRGWWFHRIDEYEAELPDSRFTVTGGTGTFTFDEIVTQQTSGATGKFKYLYTSGGTTYMYVKSVSGTFTTGSLTLTGGTSGATKTGASYTAVTTARHAFPRTSWLYAEPAATESERYIQPRDDYFYNADPDELTFDWTVDLTLNFIELVPFDEIPSHALCEYIAHDAAVKFCQYKRQEVDQTLFAFLRDFKGKANMEQNRYAGVNVFGAADGARVRAELDRVRGWWF